MSKNIVISSIGGTLHLDEEDSKWLYEHISDELKKKMDDLLNSSTLTLPEAVDYLFGTLSNKLRCNKWLCRIAEVKKEKYPHLFVNIVPTELFIIEMDRKGGEEFRSQNNCDWEQSKEWSED